MTKSFKIPIGLLAVPLLPFLAQAEQPRCRAPFFCIEHVQRTGIEGGSIIGNSADIAIIERATPAPRVENIARGVLVCDWRRETPPGVFTLCVETDLLMQARLNEAVDRKAGFQINLKSSPSK